MWVDSGRSKLSALAACVVVDSMIFSLLWLCGEITELMATQKEFLTTARLRIAEASYALRLLFFIFHCCLFA